MPNSKVYNIENTNNKQDANTIEETNDKEEQKTDNIDTTISYKRSNSVFESIIPHRAVLILLQSTLLIYNYGKSFTMNTPDETIETFVNRSIEDGSIHKLGLNSAKRAAMFELKQLAPNGKVHTFIDDPHSDIQVGITINHEQKNLAVVFRGSESIKDWYYDLQILKHKYKDKIWIHSGFYNQLHSDNIHLCIINKVRSILDQYPDYKIFVTGHSLGGALATLFGYILAHEIDNFITVVSFASPRIGNYHWKKSFEEKLNLKHFRVTNNRDLITATPTINYYHVGTDIKLYKDSFYINVGKTHSCFDYTIFSNWSVIDHSCELYYENLVNNIW
jgi:predicted lipase